MRWIYFISYFFVKGGFEMNDIDEITKYDDDFDVTEETLEELSNGKGDDNE